MLKSEMQHQFYITKKTVQRKLGSKEDQCVVSSDAELDLKIQLFESIKGTTHTLNRVLELYQERVSCLAQDETELGRFLKEHGKQSAISGKRMGTAGKAISYAGQQRMVLRAPLLRLHSELDTFRSCAVADTQATINAMERDRTEYRASLSWMKSITLDDPENDRGLEKFRKAQQTVRTSKERFDKKGLDCLEKIDLLAAARCNMFSHVLVAYQKAMTTFASKTFEAFKVASKILENEPHYTFSILRDLTQAEKDQPKQQDGPTDAPIKELRENCIDSDQLLFCQDDYTDTEEEKKEQSSSLKAEKPAAIIDCAENEADSLISVDQESASKIEQVNNSQQSSILDALDEGDSFFLDQRDTTKPSYDSMNMDFNFLEEGTPIQIPADNAQSVDPLLDLLGEGSILPSSSSGGGKSVLSMLSNKIGSSDNKSKVTKNTEKIENKSKGGKDISSWFKLFSELDPLANPDAMSKQIDASNSHST